MDRFGLPELPEAGIRLIVAGSGLRAELLELLEQQIGALPVQAAIEEDLGGGEHDAAVPVVLDLLIRLVPHADRAHAPVPLQGIDLSLFQ